MCYKNTSKVHIKILFLVVCAC